MFDWLTSTLGETTATMIYYGVAAIAAILVLWVLWYWTRRMASGVYTAHGRGRKPRLAVIDAAAIDNHRRIVLVRRDDVEHLVMIGGQNDLVIERGIGKPFPSDGEPSVPPHDSARAGEKERRTFGESRREPAPAAQPASAPVANRPEPAAVAPMRAEPAVPAAEMLRERPTREPALAPENRTPAVSAPAHVEPVVEVPGPRLEHEEPAAYAPREQVDAATAATHEYPEDRQRRDPVGLENEMERLLSELTDNRK